MSLLAAAPSRRRTSSVRPSAGPSVRPTVVSNTAAAAVTMTTSTTAPLRSPARLHYVFVLQNVRARAVWRRWLIHDSFVTSRRPNEMQIDRLQTISALTGRACGPSALVRLRCPSPRPPGPAAGLGGPLLCCFLCLLPALCLYVLRQVCWGALSERRRRHCCRYQRVDGVDNVARCFCSRCIFETKNALFVRTTCQLDGRRRRLVESGTMYLRWLSE